MSKHIYLCLITLLCSCAQLAENKESTLSNPSEPVQLGTGVSTLLLNGQSILKVQVPSNPSTGYRWTLSLPPKAVNCLTVLKDGEFTRDPKVVSKQSHCWGRLGFKSG